MKYFNSPLKFHDSPGYPSRFIGVELEVNGVTKNDDKLMAILKKWSCSVVPDGSLGYNGFEINTAPARGEAFIRQITEICDALKEAGVLLGRNCGMHIHIDARDYTKKDLLKLALVWNKVEDKVFRLVPLNRRSNNYCRKIGDSFIKNINMETMNTAKAVEQLIANIYQDGVYSPRSDDERRSLMHSKGGANRYYSLNLHSYFFRKTVENRLHDAIVDPETIIKWAKLNSKILNYAKRINISKVDSAKVLTYKRDFAKSREVPVTAGTALPVVE